MSTTDDLFGGVQRPMYLFGKEQADTIAKAAMCGRVGEIVGRKFGLRM